ncbi:hypothetical protein KR51_00007150 [Rubidibacter lacunae KORDI 51-2]|uniref:Uncharacterized protein n=1 Tax=Rubidibacter lacunae KORDI 51-2 TaxID=582515 RepID=U5DLU3_9CHRO|nr:hypothetical protein KR51_00007150 [Rubidibacter lacunae KORDI 51-2]
MSESPGPVRVDRLDHLILIVADFVRACSFDEGVLDMQAITFGNNKRALDFGLPTGQEQPNPE